MSNLKDIRAMIQRGLRGGLESNKNSLDTDECYNLCERLETYFKKQDKLLTAIKMNADTLMQDGCEDIQEMLELHADLITLMEA